MNADPVFIAIIVTVVVLLLFVDRLRKRPGNPSQTGFDGDASGSEGGLAFSNDCESSASCDGGGDGGGGGGD